MVDRLEELVVGDLMVVVEDRFPEGFVMAAPAAVAPGKGGGVVVKLCDRFTRFDGGA